MKENAGVPVRPFAYLSRVKRSTAYVLYTALMGVSIGVVSSGVVYFPYKSQSFTIGLLVAGLISLLLSMYVGVKYYYGSPDPSVKSTRQPGLISRRPYLAMVIVWAVGVVLTVFIKWAFMHSTA